MNRKEKEGLMKFIDFILEASADENIDAKIMYLYTKFRDKLFEIETELISSKSNEDVKIKFINILEQFDKILDDFKKENM